MRLRGVSGNLSKMLPTLSGSGVSRTMSTFSDFAWKFIQPTRASLQNFERVESEISYTPLLPGVVEGPFRSLFPGGRAKHRLSERGNCRVEHQGRRLDRAWYGASRRPKPRKEARVISCESKRGEKVRIPHTKYPVNHLLTSSGTLFIN